MKKFHTEEGFTLIETLVAITILTLAIVAAFSAVRSSLASANGSKNQIMAFYLAEEGIEEIRNLRDQNGIAGAASWLQNIAANGNDPCYFGKACMVDAPANTIASCGAPGSCPILREDPTTGFYGYNSSWSPTIFTREITLKQISADEVSILVTVGWARGSIGETFRIRDNIMNWQE